MPAITPNPDLILEVINRHDDRAAAAVELHGMMLDACTTAARKARSSGYLEGRAQGVLEVQDFVAERAMAITRSMAPASSLVAFGNLRGLLRFFTLSGSLDGATRN